MIAMSFITGFFWVMAIISGSLLLTLVYLDHRKSRIDDGIAPEARRNSVQRNNDERWGR